MFKLIKKLFAPLTAWNEELKEIEQTLEQECSKTKKYLESLEEDQRKKKQYLKDLDKELTKKDVDEIINMMEKTEEERSL